MQLQLPTILTRATAFLALTVSAQANPPALPDEIFAYLNTHLLEQQNSQLCGPLPDIRITSGYENQWLVVLPIKCEAMHDHALDKDYFWSWGGTAGPNIMAFRQAPNSEWLKIISVRAHAAYYVGADIVVVKHHVACSNQPPDSCIDRYRWNGNTLRIAKTGYENKSPQYSIPKPQLIGSGLPQNEGNEGE